MAATTLDLQGMRASAGQACELMKILANPERLLICCQLSQQEMCVSEIESSLGIVQPTLSQQLTVLRKANLVVTRRQGKNIYYQLASESVLAIMNALYQQFCVTQKTGRKQ